MFQHIIKGSSQDLDGILNRLSFPPSAGRIIKHGDPADAKLTSEQTRQLLTGKPLLFGTTRLEIQFN